jgi:hypothetical protein
MCILELVEQPGGVWLTAMVREWVSGMAGTGRGPFGLGMSRG